MKFKNKITGEVVEWSCILINSALISAQSRKRLYWTNISNITQPEDKHIYLKDIIESGNVDRDKSYCIDANYFKGGSLKNYLEKARRQIVNLPSEPMYQSEKRLMVEEDVLDFGNFKTENSKNRILKNVKGVDEKANCLTSSNTQNPAGCGCTNNICTTTSQSEDTSIPFKRRGHGYLPDTEYDAEKTPALFCGSGDYFEQNNHRQSECIQTGEADIEGFDIVKRTYDIEGKSPTLTTMGGGNREPKITTSETTWRKLTPLKCERLQTFSDGYTEGISSTQRYKSLGNSWTVDVIAHIFKNIEQN